MQQPAANCQWDAKSAYDMRLLEINAPSKHHGKPEETLAMLLNFLLSKGDGKTVKIPTGSVLALMNNAGLPNTYDDLDNMVKSSESAKKLIKSMNDKQVIIGKASEPANIDYPAGDETDVANMASRAAAKGLKD